MGLSKKRDRISYKIFTANRFCRFLKFRIIIRDTQSIIVLMAMILENNDLAAPILILQLLKVISNLDFDCIYRKRYLLMSLYVSRNKICCSRMIKNTKIGLFETLKIK